MSALFSNTIGNNNTANGLGALALNTSGSDNTATGLSALFSNTTGFENTANGFRALALNTTDNDNTAYGYQALYSNTTGVDNTASAYQALYFNTTGIQNTATGDFALYRNTAGAGNVAVGLAALRDNATGVANTAVGYAAGLAVTTANNVICIGQDVYGENVDNSTWIGNVYGVTTQSGTTAPVIVSDTGQLGTAASSERFKKDIATMEKASEAILSLRPVTFHYKTDTKSASQFGLIAEEVAKVNSALVLPDKEGKPYTVRYDAVNAMLLNEFLKEHRKVEEQEASITQLKNGIERLTAHLKEQDSKIEKVSAQIAAASPPRGGLEARNTAPQMVLYNQ